MHLDLSLSIINQIYHLYVFYVSFATANQQLDTKKDIRTENSLELLIDLITHFVCRAKWQENVSNDFRKLGSGKKCASKVSTTKIN